MACAHNDEIVDFSLEKTLFQSVISSALPTVFFRRNEVELIFSLRSEISNFTKFKS